MGDEPTGDEPFVISNGSYLSKAGIAGEDAPRAVFSTAIAEIRRGGMGYSVSRYVGDRATGYWRARYPIKDGVITGSWDDMESIWQHTFANELTVASEERPVLLTEKDWNPVENRRKTTEIMFEKFNVPALYLASEATLTLYGYGRTTGVAVNMGEHSISSVAVYEGSPILHSLEKMPIGGDQIVDYMVKIMSEKGYTMTSSGEREVIRHILVEMS